MGSHFSWGIVTRLSFGNFPLIGLRFFVEKFVKPSKRTTSWHPNPSLVTGVFTFAGSIRVQFTRTSCEWVVRATWMPGWAQLQGPMLWRKIQKRMQGWVILYYLGVSKNRGGPRAMDASRLFGGWLCALVFACVGCVFLLYFVVRGNTK